MFDVSHMTVVDVKGEDAFAYLSILIANDVQKLAKNGDALYTAMLNDQGGIIDDLIVYRMTYGYRLVVNCSTREGDLHWMEQVKTTQQLTAVEVEERPDLSIIAIQGPQAVERIVTLLDGEVGPMLTKMARFKGMVFNHWFIGRTGYTGEDGVEVMLPHEDAVQLWQQLVDSGVKPCGLGARDTLRLEAGMNLYGQDMDTDVSPLESNIAWTVDWRDEDRKFNGRPFLQAQREQGVPRRLVGLVLKGRGVMRAQQKIMVDGQEVGEVTSGSFSPTLGKSIALARIKAEYANAEKSESLFVDIRGKMQSVEIVKPPFVKKS